jgi:glycosyltransferase involved in cell wall biosynthesis
MKILHIIENLDNSYGGPAKSVPLLVKYLNKLGIKNKIFTVQVNTNEENSVLDENDIDVLKVPIEGIGKIKYSSILEHSIVQEITKDTIVHTHTVWTYPTYIGYKIAKKYNLPLVVSVRGTMYEWALNQSKYIKKFAMWLFQKDMLNFADAIHVTEEGEIKALQNIGINNNFILIPNGIELDNKFSSLSQDILDAINYDKDKRYIIFLGRIVHNKGLHYLISSYKILKDKYKDVEILVVGGVEDREYFNQLNKIKGIHFLGMQDGIEKHTLFSISSLFVLPSKTENFGMSIAEAMSYKIPVITTTGTPWQELEEKNAGWWIKLSQKFLDKVLVEALNCSSDELKAKGNRGFDIIKQYTWDKQAIKMKNEYLKILDKKDKKQCIY